jgi:hypothetical protein
VTESCGLGIDLDCVRDAWSMEEMRSNKAIDPAFADIVVTADAGAREVLLLSLSIW